jgi:hypothetical protein
MKEIFQLFKEPLPMTSSGHEFFFPSVSMHFERQYG